MVDRQILAAVIISGIVAYLQAEQQASPETTEPQAESKLSKSTSNAK